MGTGRLQSAARQPVMKEGSDCSASNETGAVHFASAPSGVQWDKAGYFFAIAMLLAFTKRRFTSSQLMFRMNASTYALRSEP